MTRRAGHPRLIIADGVILPNPIPVTSTLIDEAYIQDLLDRYPELIPLEDIGSTWGPLVSLGREIQSGVGPIDNLFISPAGEITLVEAKLWRNPEARRKVVAQLLDYAAAISKMSYEHFEATALGSSLWDHVSESGLTGADDEATFVDAVSRNLRTGSFLLLVVGDGIKEDVESLVGLLGTQPNLGFHLALVELRLFELDGNTLVVPSVIGRTNEVTRAIVKVRTSGEGQTYVNVEAMIEEESPIGKSVPIASFDGYLGRAAAETGPEWAAHVDTTAEWWVEECNGLMRLNETSISLYMPYRHHPAGHVPVLVLYVYGVAEFGNLHLARQTTIFDESSLDAELRGLGFTGKMRLTYRNGDSLENVRHALRSVASRITAANELEAPPVRSATRLP